MSDHPPPHAGLERLSGARARRQRAAALVAVALAAAGCWLWVHRDVPALLWSGDEYEYADVARRLARGDGFTTGVIFPPLLAYGVDRHHPSLLRPPLWPLELAAGFALAGPETWVVHAEALAFFVATAVVAAALAAELAGPWAAALAGAAVATSPQLHVVALGGLSETSYAFWTTLPFLLVLRRSHAFWIGVVCGLGYLTRYNGVALLPVLCVWLWLTPGRWRAALWCVAGFALTGMPWWLRNLAVTGDPFYSLANYNLYMAPFVQKGQTSLHYQLHPDLGSATAMNPLAKARLQLPLLLRYWPLANANLAACVGVALACARRERASLAYALLALGTTFGIAFAIALGRYFIPLVPALLALGAAGWLRYGGRLRPLGAALLLAAPLLPALPRSAPDIEWMQQGFAKLRQAVRTDPDRPRELREAAARASRCLGPGSIVVGQLVSPLVWETDALGIYLPSRPEDFWSLVDEFPVDFVELRDPRRVSKPRFERAFAPRPDCGEHLYERRVAAR